jgi:hypothetical protein
MSRSSTPFEARLKEAQERTARSAKGISKDPKKREVLQDPPPHPLSFVENADSEALPESEITFSGSEDSSGTGGDDCSSASEDFDALLARLQARADARRSQIEALRAELALVSNRCAFESDSQERPSLHESEESDSEDSEEEGYRSDP